MPTAWRLTVTFPQNVQEYFACWLISIFFTCLRSEAPYLYEMLDRVQTNQRAVEEAVRFASLSQSSREEISYLVPYLPVTPTSAT